MHLLNSTRGSMLSERRQHRRVALVTEVSCQLGREKFNAKSEKISEGGMSLAFDRAVPEGKKASLAFALPGRVSAIQVTAGVLAVVESNRVSLRFEEIKAEDKQLIREFVASQPETRAPS